MTIRIFYHITCIGSWESILNNQIHKIIYSGLYDDCENIYCYVVGAGNLKEYAKCIKILQNIGNKIIIRKTNESDQLNEAFTLSDIRNCINEDTQLLYLHTKGVTRYNTNIYKLGETEHVVENLYGNIMDWNNIMEFVLVKNYKACLKELQTHDVVGMNYVDQPPHFSGNFWWCTGKHYLTLQDVIHICEAHVCSNYPNIKNMCSTGLEGYCHYFYDYKMINYIDTFKF